MVSVIIPSYNANSTIKRAVLSVLNQTCQDVEVILIDDGCTLSDRLTRYFSGISNVRIYSFIDRRGAAACRNAGVSMARGEYVAFLDADDYWRIDKLEKQMRVLQNYSINSIRPVICFSGRALTDRSGRYTGKYIGCDRIVTYEKLLLSNQINCSSVVMKRKTAARYPFPEGNLHEDYAVWLEILRHGSFAAGIDKPLIRYTLSRSSKSGRKAASAFMTYKVYKYIGFGPLRTAFYMMMYTINGIRKYFL